MAIMPSMMEQGTNTTAVPMKPPLPALMVARLLPGQRFKLGMPLQSTSTVTAANQLPQKTLAQPLPRRPPQAKTSPP
jgi:hypothetical protein